MKRLYRFLYRTGSGDNVIYNERLLRAVKDLTSDMCITTKRKYCPNFEHFTAEQQDYVLGQCQDYLHHFGYSKPNDTGNENRRAKQTCMGLPEINKCKKQRKTRLQHVSEQRYSVASSHCRRSFQKRLSMEMGAAEDCKSNR